MNDSSCALGYMLEHVRMRWRCAGHCKHAWAQVCLHVGDGTCHRARHAACIDSAKTSCADNITMMADYYARRTLALTIGERDPLLPALLGEEANRKRKALHDA